MVRRTAEFDRSNFFRDMFTVLIPTNQLNLPTNDMWRAHRRLVGDTMSPQFLNDVISPQIYSATLGILKLWYAKMCLAKGRPFEGGDDIRRDVLDVGLPILLLLLQIEG